MLNALTFLGVDVVTGEFYDNTAQVSKPSEGRNGSSYTRTAWTQYETEGADDPEIRPGTGATRWIQLSTEPVTQGRDLWDRPMSGEPLV